MKKTYWIIIIVAVLGLLVGGYFLLGGKSEKIIEFRSGKVEKGDLQVLVTATGTLNPDTTVAVGTQVSGIITKIYVDFNSVVKKGQRIAVLDTTFLASSVEDAKSNLFRTQVQTRLTKRTYERNKTLLEQKVLAQSDFDQSQSDYETAQANEKSAQSALDRALINLHYATIVAPVSGVVISRNVDIGQTVASSFSTPTLFSIANDLTKMQLQASIDEADIGKIKVGQDVSFKVDAYVDQIFSGTVWQIRLQPVSVSNVVNYTVVINVPNGDLKLMPGMTANLTVKTQEVLNVLKVPSAALRFWPPQEYFDKHLKEYPDSIQKMIERAQKIIARRQSGQSGSGSQAGSGTPSGTGGQTAANAQAGQGNQQASGAQGSSAQPGRQNSQAASGGQPGMRRPEGVGGQSTAGRQAGAMQQQGTPGTQNNAQGQRSWGGQGGSFSRQKMGMVWVKQGNLLFPHRVKTGISDNSFTEVEGSLNEGDELITGVVNTNPAQQTTQQQNPFAPQMGRPGQPAGGAGRGGR